MRTGIKIGGLMTARDYIHELLVFDRMHPDLGVLELPIVVHNEEGRLVPAAPYHIGTDEGGLGFPYLHLDAAAPVRDETSEG